MTKKNDGPHWHPTHRFEGAMIPVLDVWPDRTIMVQSTMRCTCGAMLDAHRVGDGACPLDDEP